ncbi:MAG: GDSL-type esterase/lipase family protein, partial [bacterium]|nr:GDSL-type esterase/lipase family protein [bacterium]
MRATAILTASVLAVGAVLALAISPATAIDVSAQAQWSMVPQSKDADSDGIIDGDGGVPRRGALSLAPSQTFVGAGNRVAQPQERLIEGALSWYLSDRGFPVRLDACASTGNQFRWRIRMDDQLVDSTPWTRLTPKSCATTVLLEEDAYTLTLDVRSGAVTDTSVIRATVRNILVVALGDSYASGEGNPRNVQAWVRSGLAGSFDPYWDDDDCRRSARGAPAQAALMLENSSTTTSVTLVDVSCSDATVNQGILGAQTNASQTASQLEQARAIVGSRPVDLVTISIGGNDIGFGSILASCALNSDCPLTRASRPPLSA